MLRKIVLAISRCLTLRHCAVVTGLSAVVAALRLVCQALLPSRRLLTKADAGTLQSGNQPQLPAHLPRAKILVSATSATVHPLFDLGLTEHSCV